MVWGLGFEVQELHLACWLAWIKHFALAAEDVISHQNNGTDDAFVVGGDDHVDALAALVHRPFARDVCVGRHVQLHAPAHLEQVTRHTSNVTRHASHVKRHVTHHTSHITHDPSHQQSPHLATLRLFNSDLEVPQLLLQRLQLLVQLVQLEIGNEKKDARARAGTGEHAYTQTQTQT